MYETTNDRYNRAVWAVPQAQNLKSLPVLCIKKTMYETTNNRYNRAVWAVPQAQNLKSLPVLSIKQQKLSYWQIQKSQKYESTLYNGLL
jgi:hypothetical protein